MLKDLLVTLGKALVDKPDEVEVNAIESEKSIILQLQVASDDVGKVIGKEGRIAKSIRTIVKASAVKEGKKAVVEIVD